MTLAPSRAWWESPWLLLTLVLASALPLLWPEVPPLVDVPGHMGRYKVQIDLEHSAELQRFYRFEWALIGNLGVDLLAVPLSKLMGLEAAVKLVALMIPPLTVAGFLWVAREVHGRVPPTALFAVPLAYNFPFHYGFINFTLAMALAFLAFGLWLRLARLGRFGLRAALFVPISMVLWVAHAYGWATLSILAFSAELVRQHDKGHNYFRAAWHSGVHCLALAPPVLLMLLWRSGDVAGATTGWFKMKWKANWLIMALRDRWRWFDLVSVALVAAVPAAALATRKLGYSRNLIASALLLALAFLLLPRKLIGSFYADMRIVPYMLATAVLAVRLREGAGPRLAAGIAAAGLLFVAVRTGATAASLWLYDREYDRHVTAIDLLPRGARLLSTVGRTCKDSWTMSRLQHLPALAIVRKEAFSNDQWITAGAQLLSVHYPEGGFFVQDPTQLVTATRCRGKDWLTLNETLSEFPRGGFDYVWLIDPPAHDARLLAGYKPIWRSGSSVLYKASAKSGP